MKNKNIKALLAAGVILASGLQLSSCKKGEEDPFLSLRSRKARVAGEWTVSSMEETSTSTNEYDDDPTWDDELIMSTSTMTVSFDGSSWSVSETSENTYDGDGYLESEIQTYNASGATFSAEYEVEYTDNSSVSQEMEGDYTSSGSMTYTFEKDGTFTASITRTIGTVSEMEDDDAGYEVEITSDETETMTISGTWAFVGANKEDEFKDGERISLWYKSMSTSYSLEETEVYNDTDPDDFWDWEDEDSEYSEESSSDDTYSGTDPDETWEIVQLKNKEMKVMRSWSYSSVGEYSESYKYGNTTNKYSSDYNSTSEGTGSATLTQD